MYSVHERLTNLISQLKNGTPYANKYPNFFQLTGGGVPPLMHDDSTALAVIKQNTFKTR